MSASYTNVGVVSATLFFLSVSDPLKRSRTVASVDPPERVPELAAHSFTGRWAGLRRSAGRIPLRTRLTSDPVSMKTRISLSGSWSRQMVALNRSRTWRSFCDPSGSGC